MTESPTLAVARRYVHAMAAKDFAAVAGLFADDIVWHQPGDHRFSGTYSGAAAVNEAIGGQMAATEGTLDIAITGEPMINDALAAFPVHFSAKRNEAHMSMDGIDVLRVEGDKIAEVWLFSSDQKAENDFWDAA
ncbi:nuclear transport factor 2 family protein [Actinomadura rudentiformis]|uniref:Nuclear transport factor 2 family protein n=1 Tax=Actinomadura rudentiformis TaxID=359158 RepID=A0A6H9YQ95_9ACTN|nr:nuclear transport factor 2 family protein [Actinomadura rudentiformis]KAB2350104.1 nuclear transport factor 2 family protein [Actinomadura rudentiformis]